MLKILICYAQMNIYNNSTITYESMPLQLTDVLFYYSTYPSIFIYLGSLIFYGLFGNIIIMACFLLKNRNKHYVINNEKLSKTILIKTNHPYILESINKLAQNHSFGFYKYNGGPFIELKNVYITGNHLSCDENGKRITVSKKINSAKKLCRSRWIDHVCFKDTNNNITLLKDYIVANYNIGFRQRL